VVDESSDYILPFALALHARASTAPFPLRRRTLMETVCRLYADAAGLRHEIAEIQKRLGTADELSGDFDRAHVAAHRLGNLMAAALLAQEVG
jgi:hypothetical protein